MFTTRQSLGLAWLALTLALALHVADEATHDFLSVYNPSVLTIRQHLPWLPLPTFTFRVWLAGLVVAVLALLALAPAAFRGSRWLAGLALPYGILMLGNGLLHLGYSLATRRPMPGVWTSPLLLVAALWLLLSARHRLQASRASGDRDGA